MWDLPRPGLEPVSPALAGRFSTTAPPGKPGIRILKQERKIVIDYLLNSSGMSINTDIYGNFFLVFLGETIWGGR